MEIDVNSLTNLLFQNYVKSEKCRQTNEAILILLQRTSYYSDKNKITSLISKENEGIRSLLMDSVVPDNNLFI